MASKLDVDEIAAKNGTDPVTLTKQSAAKAWLQYLQATPVITDSFSISSVTDNSTGDFTVNYTNAFDNAGHAKSLMANSGAYCGVQARAASNTQFTNRTDAGSLSDTGAYGVFHGDLA